MTEPVGASTYTSSPPIDAAPVGASPSKPPPAPTTDSPRSSGPTLATLQLMSSHSLLPKPAPECIDRAVDVVKGAAGLVAAAGALAASGAAGPVGASIGASVIFGAVLAQYHNCEVAPAAKHDQPKPK